MVNLLQDVLANLVSSAISALFIWLLGAVLKSFRSGNAPAAKRRRYSRKALEKQFLIWLVLLPCFLAAGFLIPAPLFAETALDVLLMSGRVLCFIVAFYSFLFAWGAFSAAIEFYPPDGSRDVGGKTADASRPGEPAGIPPEDHTAQDARQEAHQKR